MQLICPFEYVFVLQKERGRATHRYLALTDQLHQGERRPIPVAQSRHQNVGIYDKSGYFFHIAGDVIVGLNWQLSIRSGVSEAVFPARMSMGAGSCVTVWRCMAKGK
jgi:hypothetical protein